MCRTFINAHFAVVLRQATVSKPSSSPTPSLLPLASPAVLSICMGTIYLKMNHSWDEVGARSALLFFVVAFLTFMSISGFPSFIESVKVFLRERLNGWYGVSVFAVANTLASAPFVFGIALISSICLYFLAGLR